MCTLLNGGSRCIYDLLNVFVDYLIWLISIYTVNVILGITKRDCDTRKRNITYVLIVQRIIYNNVNVYKILVQKKIVIGKIFRSIEYYFKVQK